MVKKILQSAILSLAISIIYVHADDDNTLVLEDHVEAIQWDDLMPKDFVYQSPLDLLTDDEFMALVDGSPEAEELMIAMAKANEQAPLVDDLNEKEVQLSGYIVPLSFDEADLDAATEFLLVPYFGACIHTPPPPANQIVYVVSKEPVDMRQIWQPFTVTGKLLVERVENDISMAGYKLEGEYVIADLGDDFNEKWLVE